jgi:Outer membrane protein beta-barrel family/Carboxypeptidase regulatory-like domain
MKIYFTRIIWLLNLLLLLSVTPLRAQTPGSRIINGSIADIHKIPLPYATVILKSSTDSGIYKTALSDDKGIFYFDNLKPGNYFIEISIVGFDKQKIPDIHIDTIYKAIDLGNIVLKASSQVLKSVTIKGQTPLIERQIDKTVVNVDQNITNAGSTVLELMQKLPGVQMTSDGQITLNGKSGTNVFIDGKPTYLSLADLASLLGGMSSSNVQKIEIMTNPSAKYDAAGNAGIINIIKKKNNKEGFNGSVNGSLGQGYYGRYNGGFTLSYKNENYNLFLNNSYTYNKSLFARTVTADILNGNNSLLTEQVSNNNDVTINRSYSPSLGLDLYLTKRTTLLLSGNLATRLSNDQTTSTLDIFNGNLVKTNREGFTAINKDKPFNYTIGIALAHQLDTMGKEFSVDFDYSSYKNKPGQYNMTTLNDPSGNFISQSNAFLDQSRQLNIYAVKADYTQQLKGNGKLEAGVKSSYVKANNNNTYYNEVNGKSLIDSTQSDYSVNTESINAAYININKKYKMLTLQSGLRAEQTVTKGEQLLTGQSVQQNYLQLFPTVFLDYKLTDKNGFNIKFGRRIERAAYHEMIPFRRPLTPTLFFEGNPNLKPQLTWHSEVTYSWHSELFVTFGYDIDHDFMRTLPYLDSNKVTVTRRLINIQGAHSWNVDLGWSKKLSGWWSTENTVSTYQNSVTGQTNGFNLDNKGIVSINLTSNNSFTINKTLSAECDFEYDSKRQLVTSTFGAYSILSFGLKQQLFSGKGAISINANNVLQSEDDTALDKYENLNQYSILHYYTRSVRLNFTYRFGSAKVVKARKESGSADEQKRAGS